MIYYSRGEWLGTHYLLYVHGSCFLRTLPTAILGALIAGSVAAARISYKDGSSDPVGEFFGDTYPMQLFGIVFGYLMVGRLNICYSRYWEGVTHVKTMHSKWADTCSQVIAFDRCEHHDVSASEDAFCCHIVRLFSQARLGPRRPPRHGRCSGAHPHIRCAVLTVWGGCVRS
jgi:predicted membrane chloride channel (bestrophin family)